jgi:ABC-2 type transport system permease protein
MNNLADMFWIEARKAIRSRMPLWTGLGSLLMPLGITFLIFVAKNPELSQSLGLVSAKADLTAYFATDWAAYLGFYAELIAAGGYFLFILAASWVFGREFADGTVKDLLAVPVPRAIILAGKFAVVAVWSAVLTALIFTAGLALGAILRLPGGSAAAILHGAALIAQTAGLVIVSVAPFALVASAGRGYLLPLSVAVLSLIVANVVVVAGWGEFFPWAVPMLFAQEQSLTGSASYWIVLLTGLAGLLGTYLWWQLADQSR